ncbi:CPBP family intramembrane metalloprotease [Panacibacter ginsenosidivorans]|uniref:CPBP family intramembrane metalloprotease n=1 Tax=Panacibacter ginsenosidivorans TaxID=1813871 RepID=A0A5B8V5V6_9BACT|nr:CPBP family glutamic-type intramembrane protease [Panacibacter ginsenosidivorans]QEC66131.1 CPBP family intramembrane metalloprotease [Panacibacter ginsenosidivorans]
MIKLPDTMIVAQQRNTTALASSILCSAACIIFAWFIHAPFPVNIIAYISLGLAAFIMSLQLLPLTTMLSQFYHHLVSSKMILFNMLGLQMGIAAALYYRHTYGMFLFPATINSFAMVAICIAVVEEVVFRGFIQGKLQKVNAGFSVVFASLSHAAYKATLFLTPFLAQKINISSLFLTSLLLFLVLGLLKQYSKSIVPCIIAHVVFDVIVYAEMTTAPWWVW